VPERAFAIGLLTNASPGAILNSTVAAWALERYLGISPTELAPIGRRPLDLDQYVGYFGFGPDGPSFAITREDDALVAAMHVVGQGQVPADNPLVFVGNDRVQASFWGLPLLADFVRTESGAVGWFRFSGRLHPRADG
jgi:hypothetical protein